MEQTKIITLKQPVTVEDQEYTEIKLREPIVNELIVSFKTIGNNGQTTAAYDAQILLVSKVSGIPKNVLEAFPTRILDQAIEYITAFQNVEVDNDHMYDQWDMVLEPPLEIANEIIDELIIQEPTVKQRKISMKQFDHYGKGIVGGLEFQVSLLTQVTGQKMAVILKLPISQFMKASNYLMRFFPNGQETGESLADS